MSDLFEEDNPEEGKVRPEGDLNLAVDGYEGPLDVLLTLARDQKVDLVQISILQLADQFLKWVAEARRRNLELAADYLVMAAWLAYLKSRLLIPTPEGEEEPSGEEMAAALQFQLQRLEAMQDAGAKLMARPQLGQDFHRRGCPEHFVSTSKTVFEVTLHDMLKAYGDIKRRAKGRVMDIEPLDLYSVDDALHRLRTMLAIGVPDWEELQHYLPPGMKAGLPTLSAVAATFTATLEMAREGMVMIRQTDTFGPIYVRSSPDGSGERGVKTTKDRTDNE